MDDERSSLERPVVIVIVALLILVGLYSLLNPSDEDDDPTDGVELNLPELECFDGDQCNTEIFSASGRINEHTIVSDPADPDHLVAGANDYNAVGDIPGCETGYAWIGTYFSEDGGQTWTNDYLPGHPCDSDVSVLSQHYGAGDPALAISPSDGKIYMAGIGIGGAVIQSSIFVARSDDGGRTFAAGNIALVDVGEGVDQFHDKEWITVDPNNGAIYVGWTDFAGGAQTAVLRVSHSTDQGATWSYPPEAVTTFTSQEDIQAVQLAVDSDSTLHVTWMDYNDHTFKISHSTDGGDSFSAPEVIATDIDYRNAIPRAAYRTPTLPMLAIDQTGGVYNDRIYLAWHDGRGGNHTDILLIYGDEGGTNWSEPVVVNRDEGEAHQFFAAPAVSPEGYVFVVYYDRSYDVNDSLLDFSYAVSTDGGDSFPFNGRLTSESADAEDQAFIGDYVGAWANENGAYGVWCDTRNPGNNGDVWFAKMVWEEALVLG